LAVREELAFHGYPLQRLKSIFGIWGAQLIVAFVFAFEHVLGGSTWQLALLGAGVGSLLFGMAAIATRGLAMPIGLHAAWNIGDWIRGGKGSVGFWKPIVEDDFKECAAIVKNNFVTAVPEILGQMSPEDTIQLLGPLWQKLREFDVKRITDKAPTFENSSNSPGNKRPASSKKSDKTVKKAPGGK